MLMLKISLTIIVILVIIGGFVFFNYNSGGSKTKSIDSSPSTENRSEPRTLSAGVNAVGTKLVG